MPTWLKALGVDSLLRAKVLGVARWAGAGLGFAVTGWLIAKGGNIDDATTIGGEIAGGIVAATSLIYTILDKNVVDNKITDARVEGAKIATANPGNVAQVATTARKDPLELAALLDSLKAKP